MGNPCTQPQLSSTTACAVTSASITHKHFFFIEKTMKQLQVFTDFSPASEKPARPWFPTHKLGNYTNAPAARAGRSVFAVSHICRLFGFHWWSFDSPSHTIQEMIQFPFWSIFLLSNHCQVIQHVNIITSIFNMSAEFSSEQVSTRASEVWWLSCFKPSKEQLNVHLYVGSFYLPTLPKTIFSNLAFPSPHTNTVCVTPWINTKEKRAFPTTASMGYF